MKTDSVGSKLRDLMEAGWTMSDLVSLQMELEQVLSYSEEKGISVSDKVKEILTQLGVPACVSGYKFLVDAIIGYIDDQSVVKSMSKNLYTAIAEKYKATPYQVSQAIYYCIEAAFDNGNLDLLDEVFGNTVSEKTGRPGAKQFIVAIAEYVMRKRKM